MSTATLQPPQANLAPPNLGDASRYSCVRNVPILDTHETQRDKEGKVTHYGVDLHRLKLLMRNGNARAARGNPAMVTLGHTHDEQDETTQPKPIGYCSRFQIGEYAGKPVLLADLCVETQHAGEASTYPRRSAEVWGQDSPDDKAHYIDVVALLRRAPNRELGLVTQYRMPGSPDRNRRAAKPVWHVCEVPARYARKASSEGQKGFGYGKDPVDPATQGRLLGGNCGTGKGGFKPGNTCAKASEEKAGGDPSLRLRSRIGYGSTSAGKKQGGLFGADPEEKPSGSDLDKDVEAFRKKQSRPIEGQSSFLDGQRRAKAGGERGPNGEWYPGGSFIATTDQPKGEPKPSGTGNAEEAIGAGTPKVKSVPAEKEPTAKPDAARAEARAAWDKSRAEGDAKLAKTWDRFRDSGADAIFGWVPDGNPSSVPKGMGVVAKNWQAWLDGGVDLERALMLLRGEVLDKLVADEKGSSKGDVGPEDEAAIAENLDWEIEHEDGWFLPAKHRKKFPRSGAAYMLARDLGEDMDGLERLAKVFEQLGSKPDRNASPLTPDRLIAALRPDRHTIRREALARVVARYQMPVALSSCGAGAQGSPGFQRGNTCGNRGGGTRPIPATHAPAKAAPTPASPGRAKLIGDLRSIAAGHDENDHGQRRKMADAFAQRLSADLSDEDALNLARKVLPAGIASKLTDKASAIEAIRRGLAGKQPKEQLPAQIAPAGPTPRQQADWHRQTKGEDQTRRGMLVEQLRKKAQADKRAAGRAEASGNIGKAVARKERALARTNRFAGLAEGMAGEASSNVIDLQPKGDTWGQAPAKQPRPPKSRTPKLGEKVQKARSASKPQRQAFIARLKAVAQAEKAQGNDPTSHTDHAPGTVTMLKSDLVDFDPGRFQYKMGGSTKTGSVGSLGGVKKWDDELAGVIQVWKDPANGKTYVVNGHNRMDLAKKLGVPNVAVRFLAAKDADEAMAKGALTNIAEGRGTAIDAGNFFRRSGASRETLESKGIPMRERVATVGLALAGLPDNLFNDVTTGDLTEEQGAAIGGAGLTPEQQVSVAKRAKEGDFSLGKLKEFVDLAKMAGSRSGNQASLFGGGGGDDEALFEHRADLQSHIKRKLAGEKNIFKGASSARAAALLSDVGNQLNVEGTKTAGDQAAMALHLFGTLTKRAGSSAGRLMNKFATQMAEAKTARERKKLLDDAYGQVRDSVPMWLEELEDFGVDQSKPAAPSGPSMF